MKLICVHRGSYGIGVPRLMGTVVEVHHDNRGIIWPEEVAPFKVHLLEVKSKKLKVKSKADELYEKLQQAGVEVLYDDREEVGAGEKFAEADLIGCPLRVVVSEKTLAKDSVEVKKRDGEKCELVKLSDAVKYFNG